MPQVLPIPTNFGRDSTRIGAVPTAFGTSRAVWRGLRLSPNPRGKGRARRLAHALADRTVAINPANASRPKARHVCRCIVLWRSPVLALILGRWSTSKIPSRSAERARGP